MALARRAVVTAVELINSRLFPPGKALAGLGLRFAPVSLQNKNMIPVRYYAKKMKSEPKKPLSFDHSGDLVTQTTLDSNLIKYDFKGLSELQESDDELPLKRLFSIEFSDGREIKDHRMKECVDQMVELLGPDAILERRSKYFLVAEQFTSGCFAIRRFTPSYFNPRHFATSKFQTLQDSEEKKIDTLRAIDFAAHTVTIRNLIPHCLKFRKDKFNKSILIEKIDKRKKCLKNLQKIDRERFEWLLKVLEIKYTPHPAYHNHLTKKARRKKEVRERVMAIHAEKMKQVANLLEAEKEEFYKYKERVLAEIQRDLEWLNIDKDDVYNSGALAKEKRLEKAKTIQTGRIWY